MAKKKTQIQESVQADNQSSKELGGACAFEALSTRPIHFNKFDVECLTSTSVRGQNVQQLEQYFGILRHSLNLFLVLSCSVHVDLEGLFLFYFCGSPADVSFFFFLVFPCQKPIEI